MEKITVEQIMDLMSKDGYQIRVGYWYSDYDSMTDELRTVPEWSLFKNYPIQEIVHRDGKMYIVVDCIDPLKVYAEDVFGSLLTDDEWKGIKKWLPNDWEDHGKELELWKARFDYQKELTKYYQTHATVKALETAWGYNLEVYTCPNEWCDKDGNLNSLVKVDRKAHLYDVVADIPCGSPTGEYICAIVDKGE